MTSLEPDSDRAIPGPRDTDRSTHAGPLLGRERSRIDGKQPELLRTECVGGAKGFGRSQGIPRPGRTDYGSEGWGFESLRACR